MSGWKGHVLSVVVVAALLCHTVNAYAAQPEEGALQTAIGHSEPGVEDPVNCEQQADTVYNENELAEWMEQHIETGGTVFLGNRVTITQPIGIYNNAEITIDTGEYGFVFDGAALPTNRILITGEGVEVPVVEVVRIGSGFFWENSWNNTLLELRVTATGRDGQGGTALRILTEDTKSFRLDLLNEQGEIRSYGRGAIGLWLEVPMEAWCYRVEVSGENSTAVYAPQGADLTYCKLTAEGNGAAATAGNDILLDSCAVSPPPSGVQSIHRRALEESFSRLYLPLKQNTYDFSAIMLFNTPNVFLADEEGGVISRPFTVYWDIASYDKIDTGVLGKTKLSGTVDPALYDLGVFDDVTIELMVEVRNPALPCISRIAVRELDKQKYAVLNFWQTYDPLEENVVLWRSEDEGKTWQDATHEPDIVWNGDTVQVIYDTLEHSVWFHLEVIGAGKSNIAILDERDGIFIGGNGGDRTGTDRDGVTPSGGDKGHTRRPDRSKPHAPETNTQTKDNADVPDDGLNAQMVTATADDTLPPNMQAETAPAETPAQAIFPQTVPAAEQPETKTTQPVTESSMAPGKKEPATAAQEKSLPLDPVQSVPEPGFSAKALTVFFLSVAGLCFVALLVLRFGHFGGWKREKP